MLITNPQRQAIDTFVKEWSGAYTMAQFMAIGECWAKDSTVWKHIRQGAAGQLTLVCWYNYTHRPGANEWRPAVIILAVLEHLKLPYSNGLRAAPSLP